MTTPLFHGCLSSPGSCFALNLTTSPTLNLGFSFRAFSWRAPVSASCDARLSVSEPARRGFLFMLTFPFLLDDLVIIPEVDSILGSASPFGFLASLSQVIPSSSIVSGFMRISLTIFFSLDPFSGSQVTLTPTVSPPELACSSPQRYVLVSCTSLVLYPFGLLTSRLKRSCSFLSCAVMDCQTSPCGSSMSSRNDFEVARFLLGGEDPPSIIASRSAL